MLDMDKLWGPEVGKFSKQHESAQLISVLQNLKEGVIITDPKGGIQLINTCALQHFNFSIKEIYTKSIQSLFPSLSSKFWQHLSHKRNKFYSQNFGLKPQNKLGSGG